MAFTRLGETLRELRGYKQAFLMMLAFTIYNDGIQTIIKMASVYGTEIGIGQGDLITADPAGAVHRHSVRLRVRGAGGPNRRQALGVPRARGVHRHLHLRLHHDVGARVLHPGRARGLVQGGTQALSRSLFATLIPKHKSGEFFGFFSVFEKFGGILGPLVFALVINRFQSSQLAILSVIVFFVLGGAMLLFVDVEAGERAAREAERNVRTVPA